MRYLPVLLRPRASTTWRAVEPACSGLAVPTSTAATAQLQQLGFATASIVTARGAAFWQLVIAFVCGGLFVTGAIGTILLAYTYGATNVDRAKRMLSLVVRRTFDIAMTMFGAASMALLRRRIPGAPCVPDDDDSECPVDERSRWREAWLILIAGFIKVRRTATEGVEALKLELSFAESAGRPALVGFQYIVDRYTPLRLQAMLEQSLRESLEDIEIGSRKIVLKQFNVGSATPQLLAARTYDIGPTALGFDFDTSWESELVANLEAVPADDDDYDELGDLISDFEPLEPLARGIRAVPVPVTVRNLRFSGPVRVVVTHLSAEDPGFGAILLSLPAPPEIGLDVRVAGGEVTRACHPCVAEPPPSSAHSSHTLPPPPPTRAR